MPDVRYTRRALANLWSHEAWLRRRDPLAADRFADDVARAARLLSEHPLAGRPLAGTTLRAIVTTRYRSRLFYRVRDGVTVVRILHARQDG